MVLWQFLENHVQGTGKVFLLGRSSQRKGEEGWLEPLLLRAGLLWRGQATTEWIVPEMSQTKPVLGGLGLRCWGSCKKNDLCVQRILKVAHGLAFLRHLIWLLGLFYIFKSYMNAYWKQSNLNLPKQQWIRLPDCEPIERDMLSFCLCQESA